MTIDPELWPALSKLLDEWLDLPEESRAAWLGGLETGETEIWTNDRYLLAAVAHFGLAGHSI